MSSPRRRAVTFDLWYTLLGLEPADEEAYLESLVEAAARRLRASPADGRGASIPSLPDARMAFRRQFDRGVSECRQGRSFGPVDQIRAAGVVLGRRPDPRRYLRDIARLIEDLPFHVAPGAPEAMASLRSAGYRIGVVSNTVGEPGQALEAACQRLGLADAVEAWAWSDEHPWTKPAPDLFRWCLRRLRVQPSAAVHVGDAYSDMAGARAAGLMGSVRFTGLSTYSPEYRRGFAPPIPRSAGPTVTVRSFSRVPAVVDRLFDAPRVGRGVAGFVKV